MRTIFAYTRVSTGWQGETGVSLQEQRIAIERYAASHRMSIDKWFEEQETASRRGRPVFTKMLAALQEGKARGVIMHRIDRSARNLRDWADLGELLDQGVEVRFAGDNLDLTSRSGRLSADIQAVVAADYIRNLREETIKGFYGRLRQGLCPMPAPVGYLDVGRGKVKEVDPVMAPLVREVFRLYATGEFTLRGLAANVVSVGLKTRHGGPCTHKSLSQLLRNPFYIGLIKIGKTGQVFIGQHRAIVDRPLFEEVQRVLGTRYHKRQRRSFLFSRLIRCQCGYSLIGERQKNRVYYRCHTSSCPVCSIREDAVIAALAREQIDHWDADSLRSLQRTLEAVYVVETGDTKVSAGNFNGLVSNTGSATSVGAAGLSSACCPGDR